MKNLLIFLVVLNFYACKKDAIKEVDGYFAVSGESVRCSYYYCDTTLINTILWVQVFNDNNRIQIQYYDSTANEFENLSSLEFEQMNAKEIVFSGYYTTKLTIDKETNFLKYYEYINNKKSLEDTVSQYFRIEGYKQ